MNVERNTGARSGHQVADGHVVSRPASSRLLTDAPSSSEFSVSLECICSGLVSWEHHSKRRVARVGAYALHLLPVNNADFRRQKNKEKQNVRTWRVRDSMTLHTSTDPSFSQCHCYCVTVETNMSSPCNRKHSYVHSRSYLPSLTLKVIRR